MLGVRRLTIWWLMPEEPGARFGVLCRISLVSSDVIGEVRIWLLLRMEVSIIGDGWV